MYNYKTYKFYTKKGERLSIYGIQNGENIEIITIPCSKNDQFIKKTGDSLFKSIKETPGTLTKHDIKVIKGEDQRDFIRYCNSNFYKEINIKIDPMVKINNIYNTLGGRNCTIINAIYKK